MEHGRPDHQIAFTGRLQKTRRHAQKEAERQQKLAIKEQIASDAEDAVSEWEDYLHDLVTLHCNLTRKINWIEIASRPAPPEPKKVTFRQEAAQQALTDFHPHLFDFLRGGSARRKKNLEETLDQALQADNNDFSDSKAEYAEELQTWTSNRELALAILAGEPDAIKDVIHEYQSLTEIDLIGTEVEFIVEPGFLHAKPYVHGNDIVPKIRRKLLSSGRLSETAMPTSQQLELYQDYVASVALKVAGDLFQLTPLDQIYVTCMSAMLNSSTGYIEPTPVLSVQFVRKTMDTINLKKIDPSDALSNFNHVMDFKKTKGFSPISPLASEHESS